MPNRQIAYVGVEGGKATRACGLSSYRLSGKCHNLLYPCGETPTRIPPLRLDTTRYRAFRLDTDLAHRLQVNRQVAIKPPKERPTWKTEYVEQCAEWALYLVDDNGQDVCGPCSLEGANDGE